MFIVTKFFEITNINLERPEVSGKFLVAKQFQIAINDLVTITKLKSFLCGLSVAIQTKQSSVAAFILFMPENLHSQSAVETGIMTGIEMCFATFGISTKFQCFKFFCAKLFSKLQQQGKARCVSYMWFDEPVHTLQCWHNSFKFSTLWLVIVFCNFFVLFKLVSILTASLCTVNFAWTFTLLSCSVAYPDRCFDFTICLSTATFWNGL